MTLPELMAIVEAELKTGYRSLSSRYWPVEPDGKVAYSGYQQKPAALRSVRHTGKGLWDSRNREFVVLPDTDSRLKRMRDDKDHLTRQMQELDARIASITHRGYR